jgi:hypothetical protein
MAYVLNRLPHRSGARLTRTEKWTGRLLPHQRSRIRTWGCAAYVPLRYGERGNIGPKRSKFEPVAELFVMFGYDDNGMGYRLAALPTFKVRTSIHCTFVEEHFPCRTDVPKQLGAFLTPTLEERYPATPALSAAHSSAGDMNRAESSSSSARAERTRTPSPAALEAIANGPASPPDPVNAAFDDITSDITSDFAPLYFDTVYADISGDANTPATVTAGLNGPDAAQWRTALKREHDQHLKNNTFGPPIDPKDLPVGCKPIPFDCILKIKRDGTRKVRGIIKGFHMTQGQDYNETFAPVPCMTALRLLLANTAAYDWEAKQGDVHTAFL